MGSREIEERNNLERDLNVLLNNYLLLSPNKQFELINKIINLMYELKGE